MGGPPSVPAPRYGLGVPRRPLRPLVCVLLLALGDYALWNWSLSANHDIVALISGMTLIPLLIASVWLLALTGAHLLARAARRPGEIARASARHPTTKHAPTLRDPAAAGAGEVRATASPSSKIAA
jgi:hypothetical protein